MRTVLAALALMLALPLAAQGPNNPAIVMVGTAPSGSCTNGVAGQLVIGTGHIWTCQSGTWTDATGGGGSGSVGTAGQLQMVGATAGSFKASAVTDNGTTVSSSEPFCVGSSCPTTGVSIGPLGSPTKWNFDTTSPATALASIGAGPAGALVNITGSSQITAAGCVQSASIGGSCVVTGSPASSITLSVIPGTGQDLELTVNGTSSYAGAVNVQVQFNGDTGSNYDFALAYTLGGATTTQGGATSNTGSTSAQLCDLGQTGAYAGGGKILIQQYAGVVFKKNMQGLCGAESATFYGSLTSFSGDWRSTSAITSITLTMQASATFSVGDTVVLRMVN